MSRKIPQEIKLKGDFHLNFDKSGFNRDCQRSITDSTNNKVQFRLRLIVLFIC